MIDRSEVNRALAKAIAFKQCGDDRKANQWACELVKLLECAAILRDDVSSPAEAVYAPLPVYDPRVIRCNWCGQQHVQPAQSAAEHLSPNSACRGDRA